MKNNKSLILQESCRYLKYMLLGFSIFLLLRGHNKPGGGFVGGLMASSAVILFAMAHEVIDARKFIRLQPRTFIASGLISAALSGIISLFSNEPFMTGKWVDLELPFHIHLALGTPLLFDIGVYLVVFGVTLNMIFALLEE